MATKPMVYIAPATARRALIGLVAEVAWAERRGAGPPSLERMRDEAMSLLVRIDQGDPEAARRAMQLVSHAGDRAG